VNSSLNLNLTDFFFFLYVYLGGAKNLQVTIVGARNLKAMDRGGTSDPYARVRIGTKGVYKTKHIKKTLTPEW
jgi:Ca2+-dependent lipid-binding protein